MDYRRKENQLISMIDRRKEQVKEVVRTERKVRSWADRTYLAINEKYAEARA